MNANEMKLYKLRTTPSGRKLWTYMAAILEVTGMDQGKVFPLKKFLGNFGTHLENERIEAADGGYKLTAKGIRYFKDRYNEENIQRIDRDEVEIMIRGITTGRNYGDWIEVS